MVNECKRIRGWCFTLNNYTEEEVRYIEEMAATYLVYGREVGEQGTPHLQGYVYFPSGKTLSAVSRIFGGRAHLESRKGTHKQAADYCKKDGLFKEIGTCPLDPVAKGDLEKDRWDEIWSSAVDGDLMDIPARERILHWKTLNNIRNAFRKADADIDGDLCNLWYYGPPGTGKSYSARAEFGGSLFLKNSNKWWCGYDGEETVLIDELEVDAGKFMGHFLKIWGDRYAFKAETKGSQLPNIRPKRIVVTSNYSIDEVFGFDVQLCSAIKRRFRGVRFNDILPARPDEIRAGQLYDFDM